MSDDTGDPLNFAPHSIEMEECTLGAIFMNPAAINTAIAFLGKDDFFIVRHGWIYEAMLRVYQRGDALDIRTVAEELRALHRLDEVGGEAYLSYLPTNVPTALNAEIYAQLVKRSSLRRQLIGVASTIAGLAHDETLDIEGVVNAAQEAVFAVQLTDVRGTLREFHTVLGDLHDWLEEAMQREDMVRELPTPWPDLDRVFYGLGEEELIVPAAAPKTGKSAFMMQLATHTARQHKRVLMFSLEMGERALMQRIVAQETGISTEHQRKMNGAQWDRFLSWMNKGAGFEKEYASQLFGITFDTGLSRTAMQIMAKCRDFKRRRGLDLVIVDYLQLMGSDTTRGNRNEQLGQMTRALKTLAMELHIPVVVASQFSRDSRKQNRRPMLYDLRESGAIEQDLDKAIFIHDPDAIDNDEYTGPQNGRKEFIVAAHRNGPTGIVPVTWLGERIKFVSMTTRKGFGS